MAFSEYFNFLRPTENKSALPTYSNGMETSTFDLQRAKEANPLFSGSSLAETPAAFDVATPTLNLPTASPANGWFSKTSLFGDAKTRAGGWVSPALQALTAGMQFYQGNKQLDLAEDQLSTQKQQFSDQFNLQKGMINSDIRDQGQRRYDRNSTLNPTPEDYYNANKV